MLHEARGREKTQYVTQSVSPSPFLDTKSNKNLIKQKEKGATRSGKSEHAQYVQPLLVPIRFMEFALWFTKPTNRRQLDGRRDRRRRMSMDDF